MNETYKIRSVGGALIVTIPQHIARESGLKVGDAVVFAVTGFKKNVVIERAPTKRNGSKK